MAFERRFVEREGGRQSYLNWDRAGSGAPRIHFAHANGMNAQTYQRLLEPLADRLQIIAWDARGHGQSTLNNDPEILTDWDVYRDDMKDFLQTFAEPMVLVGHSLGAVTSLNVAACYPELVKALVLLDPVMFPTWFLTPWKWAKSLGLAHHLSVAKMAKKRRAVWNSLDEMMEAYRGRGVFRTWPEECLKDYLEGGTESLPDGRVRLSCPPEWESKTFSTMSHIVWQRLSEVRCPITLVYGGHSNTFFGGSAHCFLRRKPNARMICVQQASHFIPLEEQDLVRGEIVRRARKAG